MLTVSEEVIGKNVQKYFSLIEQTGEDIIVTRRNIPLIKLTSLKSGKRVSDVFMDVRGRVKYHDDILAPETEEWGELQE